MPATKFDVANLNLKSHDLFEAGRAFFVRDHEQKKSCDQMIAEIVELSAEGLAAYNSKELTPADAKEVMRAVEKLNIAKNYLSKAVGAFNSVETNRKTTADNLAKARKEKDALISKNSEAKKVREENRKKKEAEDAKAKAKA